MVGFSISINFGVTIFTSVDVTHRNPNFIFSFKRPAAGLLKAHDCSDGSMGSSSLGVPILWNLKLNLAPDQTLGVCVPYGGSLQHVIYSQPVFYAQMNEEHLDLRPVSPLLALGCCLRFVSECECFEIYVWLHYTLVWVLESGWHDLKIWLYNLLGVTTGKLSTSL